MRDILVTAIITVGLLMAFRRPYIGALLWVWIGLMNPHRLGWSFAYSMPFAMITAIVLFISMAINPDKVRWPKGGAVLLLLLLVAWMGITTLGAIFYDLSLPKYVATLKVLLMTLVVAAVVRTKEEILGLVLVTVGSIAFFGVKGGIFTAMTGGVNRVWGPPSSVIEGNNELAVALVITIPLLYYLAHQVPLVRQLPLMRRISEKWMTRGFYAAMPLCMIAALGSYSRGAVLAMAAMCTVFWLRSKSKLAVAVLILMVLAVALYFMPDAWLGRMNTLGTYDEDSSAMGRINAWTMAINIANDRMMGAGFETASPLIYLRYAPNPDSVLVAHSIYFQILGEHGYIGLFLYLGFWFTTYISAGRLIKLTADNDELRWAHMLGSMTKVSLVGFAVGGAFLSIAYWDMPFYLMVILVCTERWVRDSLRESLKTDTRLAAPSAAAIAYPEGRMP